MRTCTDCARALPLTEFYWVSKATEKLRGQCKACMRASKEAQRQPDWTSGCSRCGERLPERVGSGRRLCAACFDQTYDTEHRRERGSHRVRLKPCTLCGGAKERFERGKLCGACKPWENYAQNLRRFGLTPRDYMALLDAQGGACFVCRQPPNGKRLCIDHDHAIPEGRSAVRGLLCDECNYSRLPRFKDDATMLTRAADYLRQPPAAAVLVPLFSSLTFSACDRRPVDSVSRRGLLSSLVSDVGSAPDDSGRHHEQPSASGIG